MDSPIIAAVIGGCVVLVLAVVSYAITYGLDKGAIEALKARLDVLEAVRPNISDLRVDLGKLEATLSNAVEQINSLAAYLREHEPTRITMQRRQAPRKAPTSGRQT